MDCNFLVLKCRIHNCHNCFISSFSFDAVVHFFFIFFFKTFMFIYLNLKKLGHRAGMPEWSKGPDSSKICFLTKIQDFW